MYNNYTYMKTEILVESVRFYFNYEEEQSKSRIEYLDIEEHPCREQYVDFDYNIPFTYLPSYTIIPIVSNNAFEAQIEKGITEQWALSKGAMSLGDAAIFKTIEMNPYGETYEVIRMTIGVLSQHWKSSEWKGVCLSYN